MSTRTRIVDWDGIPHNADTGEALHGVSTEPNTHWVDDLPAVSLDGLKLVTSPDDMVFDTTLWSWMRRSEWERLHGKTTPEVFDFLADEFSHARPGLASAELSRRDAQKGEAA